VAARFPRRIRHNHRSISFLCARAQQWPLVLYLSITRTLKFGTEEDVMSKTAVPRSAVMIVFFAAATAAQAQTHESDIRIWHPLLSAGSTVSTD
jgi:hypothetical protein